MRLKKSKQHLALLVAVFGFLLYANTLNYSYTLDDFRVIKYNKFVKEGLAGIGDILSSSYHAGYDKFDLTLYRPLSSVMFAVEWQFFPDNPSAGHFINVLLYALTGYFLFKLLCRLFKNNLLIPLLASLLFMAHPVHTEAVASIKSGDEILGFLLSILSISMLFDYVQSGRQIKLIWSALVFFLALLSKESVVAMIAVIPLMLFVFTDQSLRKIIFSIIPHSAAVLLFLTIRYLVLHKSINLEFAAMDTNVLVSAPDLITRIATSIYILGRYFILLILPVHLSYDYGFSEIALHHFTDFSVLFFSVLYLALAGYALLKIRNRNIPTFSILYFLITISIVSNIPMLIGTAMGERLLYSPSFGFCLAIAALLYKLFRRTPEQSIELTGLLKNNMRLVTLFSAVVLLCSFKTITRNSVWKDQLSLKESGLTDAPNSCRVHYLFAQELIGKYAHEEKEAAKRDSIYKIAKDELEKAIDINKSYVEAYQAMGKIHAQQGDTASALACYDRGLKNIPGNSLLLNDKGFLFLVQNNVMEAMKLFKQAVNNDSHCLFALKNLGSCYLKMGDYDKALTYYLEALKYERDDGGIRFTRYLIGTAYQYKGDVQLADSYFAEPKFRK